MDFFEKLDEKKWVVITLLLTVVIVILLFLTFFKQESLVVEEVSDYSSSIGQTTETISNQTQQNEMYVDIKGAVVKPGIYKVDSTMRVLNVVELAGGFLKDADDQQINLSERVSDQMVIYIPKEGEKLEEVAIAKKETGESNKQSDESLINLNTATADELKKLNGVGDRKAENIIRHREEKGSFKNIDELKDVDGIGEKTFENLKSLITV